MFRWASIGNMIQFTNAVYGTAVANWVAGSNMLAFSRPVADNDHILLDQSTNSKLTAANDCEIQLTCLVLHGPISFQAPCHRISTRWDNCNMATFVT